MLSFNNIIAQKMAFWAQNTANLCHKMITTMFFSRKTPMFSKKNGENRRKYSL
jgi:hypothetical protein